LPVFYLQAQALLTYAGLAAAGIGVFELESIPIMITTGDRYARWHRGNTAGSLIKLGSEFCPKLRPIGLALQIAGGITGGIGGYTRLTELDKHYNP